MQRGINQYFLCYVRLSYAISVNCIELVHIFQQPSKLLLLLSDTQMQVLT